MYKTKWNLMWNLMGTEYDLIHLVPLSQWEILGTLEKFKA